MKPLLKSGDMRRWGVRWKGLSLIFPYIEDGGRVRGITPEELTVRYPLAHAYFARYAEILKGRENGKGRGSRDWHLYLYNKSLDKFSLPRIFTPNLSPHGSFSFDAGGQYAFVGGVGGGYGIVLKDRSERAFFYALGVLNSRPIEFYHHLVSSPFQGGWFSNARQFIEPLPIPEGTAESRKAIAKLAQDLTEAHARLHGLVEGTDRYREALRETDQLEGQLDKLTLDLFGITPEEEKLLPPRSGPSP